MDVGQGHGGKRSPQELCSPPQTAPSAATERQRVCPEQGSALSGLGDGKCSSSGDKHRPKKADCTVNLVEAGPKDLKPLCLTDTAFTRQDHGKSLEFCGSSRFYTELSFPLPPFVPVARADSEDVNVNPGAQPSQANWACPGRVLFRAVPRESRFVLKGINPRHPGSPEMSVRGLSCCNLLFTPRNVAGV